jgi:hypothetical protein
VIGFADDYCCFLYAIGVIVEELAMKTLHLALATLVCLMVAATPAHALRSTKHESFTDPDFVGYQPSKVVLVINIQNLDIRDAIENRLSKELSRRGVEVLDERDLFPPTRQWDPEARKRILEQHGVTSVIVFDVGDSSHTVSQIGSNTYSSATAYGYGNSATATGTSTTVPIVSANSESSFSAVLLDVSSGRIAWTADIHTKAGGTLFAGGKKDANAAAKAVVKSMSADGHIAGAK